MRGEFKPIPTSVTGVTFGEHLPKFAKQMHRCTLIRSANHSVNNAHAAAVCALTGHDRGEIGGGARPDDYPCIGSVVGMQHPPKTAALAARAAAVHHEEGAGGPPANRASSAAGSANTRPARHSPRPQRAGFLGRFPELTLGPDIDPARFDAREKQLEQKLATSRKGRQFAG